LEKEKNIDLMVLELKEESNKKMIKEQELEEMKRLLNESQENFDVKMKSMITSHGVEIDELKSTHGMKILHREGNIRTLQEEFSRCVLEIQNKDVVISELKLELEEIRKNNTSSLDERVEDLTLEVSSLKGLVETKNQEITGTLEKLKISEGQLGELTKKFDETMRGLQFTVSEKENTLLQR
jgi:hypothetical protein